VSALRATESAARVTSRPVSALLASAPRFMIGRAHYAGRVQPSNWPIARQHQGKCHGLQWQRTALLFALATLVPALAIGAVERRQFTATAGYLVVEVLDDDLVHFEASAIGSPPSLAQPLYTSPMVLKKDYGGPSAFTDGGLTLETPAMRLIVEATSLCVRVEDKARGNGHLSRSAPSIWTSHSRASTSIRPA
jgi:hypothetical protein